MPEGQTQTQAPFDPVIRGGDENDTLTGTDGADEFVAGAGDDLVFAGAGDDTVDAGAGNDTVYGGAGDDTIDGGAGNDTLYGDGDDDTISGGAGNDTIFGNDGDDEIEGGDGNNIAFGGAGSGDINMGDGDDFIGTSGDDGSDDDYDGGAGNDTVSFATDVEGVTVNMDEDDNAEFDIDANTARGDDTGEDTIEGIENVTTGSGVDTLRISMTRDEFESSEFQAEVAAYHADPSTPFHFDSINMDVESFEQLQIEVDGTIIVAEPPTLEVGDVFGAEDTAILLGVGASLNDTDGAESLEVEIGGLPEGSTLHYIDGNGAAQSIEITEGEGTVVISGETQAVLDTLAVTPPEGDSGDFSIEVTATAVELDGSVSSVSDSFNVIVNGIPSALPESVSGDEDSGVLTGNLTDQIGGDGTIDPDSDDLAFSIDGVTPDANGDYVVSSPEGTLTLHADGSYEFAIDSSLQGLDDGESAVAQFTFTATDNGQPILSDDNTLTVTVTGSNDGPVAEVALIEGTEDSGVLTGNLEASDLDGDALTFGIQGSTPDANGVTTVDVEGSVDGSTVTIGQLVVQPDGSYAFTPDNDALQGLNVGDAVTANFAFTASDGTETTSAVLEITLTGTDDGLVALAETVEGGEDAGTLTGNLEATDADSENLTFGLAAGEDGEGQYGSLTVNADGSYSFDIAEAAQALDDGETVIETFTYEVTSDDETTTETVTVTITGSNDGPVATAETVSGGEDAGTLTGNLDATDIEGDDLTFSLQSNGEGQYGTLSVNPDGSYSFDIAEAAQGLDDGESAVETFTYDVTDGDVTTTETVTVTITGSNDGPVASAETVAGGEDAGTLTGNLDATDIDGDDLTFSLQGDGEGQYGTLSVNPDGSYSFDIAEAAQGLDDGESAVETFTYEVTDGDVTTTETVTVTITGSNDGPVASAETVAGGEDAGTLTGNLDASDIDGDDLTFSLQGDGEGQYGDLTVNANGTYSFAIGAAAQALDDGESAVETFTYEVTDGDVTTTETVTVTFQGSNDGPVAAAETVSGGEDAGTLTGNLEATDIEGDDLTFSLQGDGEGQYGDLTVNADGSYSFDIGSAAQGLDDGESAVEVFTYEVTDGDVVSTNTVSVTITGSNDGPVAQAEAISGSEDAGTLTGNLDAFDVDGDELTFSLQGSGEGTYGTLSVNANGSYSFAISDAAQALEESESVVETFTYEVTDGDETSTQSVSVTITGASEGNFIVGTECHDYLVGTSGADNISGLGGNDWIWAGDGDDIVDGGDGHDAIGGGGGNDIIDGGDGHDAVWGGSGNDTLNGGAGDDRIKGGTGDDATSAGSGDDRIHGGSGDDVIEGGFGEDDIDGGSGNDIIYGDTASYDGPDYSAVVNEYGPVAFWRLDDTNGTTATDETGNHDGTYEGGVEIGEAGAVGDSAGAAVFDGRNDHVEVPHDAAFEAESGTVMMWVRPDDLGGDQGLFSKDSKNYDDGGHLHIELDGSKVKVRLQGRENENEDFSSHTVESPSGTAQEGQWMQVAFTWGATGMALYVNGTLVDTDSFTGGIEDNQEPIVMGASQTHSGDQSTSGLREFFEGAMDEVAFFGTALSDEAIADTFTAGSWNLGSDDEIEAGSGDDVVYGGAGDDEIEGESGDDELHGGAGEDDIDGGSGHDTIYGDAGDDKIEGGSGDDTIYGGEGDDEIDGDSGNDLIVGGLGDDEIDGGLGDDIIIGGDGADILDGGSGENIFMYNAASEGGDTVVGFDSDKDMFQFDGDDFGGFGNYTVHNDGSDFKIIGDDGSEIGFDDDSNTLFYRSGDDAGEGYQTIATVSGDDVTSDDIEII